jgi:L-Ala-D/L-Glu epimerase
MPIGWRVPMRRRNSKPANRPFRWSALTPMGWSTQRPDQRIAVNALHPPVCNSSRELKNPGMAPALPSVTVRSLRSRPLNIPLKAPFGISQGSLDFAANALVTVELSDGTLGYGEAAPFPAYNGETQSAALAQLAAAAAWVPGRDAADWKAISSEFRAKAGAGSGSARCALESALLYALTRRAGIPLWQFFGGAGTELETDMTVTTGTPAQAGEAARQIRSRGIRSIKVKVGGPEEGSGGPDADLARISAILEAAPGSPLILDGNAGLTRAQAGRLVGGLKSRGIVPALLEQWLPKDDLAGMRALRSESGFPVAADESVTSAADAARVAQAGAADVINIKLMKAGIQEALEVVSVARQSGLGLMIGGNVESILAMTVSACFAAGQGGFDFADLDTPLFMAENPFIGGFSMDGGLISVAHLHSGHGVRPI